MNRSIPLALALVLVVSLTALPLAGATTQAQPADQAAAGEQLDAALGVQQAEIDAAVENRAFGLEVAQANSSDEVAAIVAERVDELGQDVSELEDQSQDIEQSAQDNSSNAADAATMAAEAAAIDRQAQTVAAVADAIPEDVRAEHDITISAIEELSTSANELSTTEIVELAQSIAGESVGTPLDDDWEAGLPDDVTLPDEADQNDNAP